VLVDTSEVLLLDPGNLKALYRRSLACEATHDLDSAITAVDEILRIQPDNELALEARKRFAAAAATTAAALKLKVDKSVDLKNLGNDAMKSGKCEAAINFYSEAIQCDGSNILFFNNRAQAYIKTSQFVKAEADATHVILNDPASAPNLKAYYRRALARKGISTVESLRSALEDVSCILSHEPDNKAASSEKQKIGTLLKAQLDATRKRDNEKGGKDRVVEKESILIKESTSADNNNNNKNSSSGAISGLTERSSKVRVRSEEQKEADIQRVVVESSSTPQKEEKEKKVRTKAAKDISIKNPIVPVDPPKTVYEFERIWRGLKNRPDLFAVYLKCFKKSTYKKVLKDTCSPDLLSSLLVSVRDHMLVAGSEGGDVDKGVSVLEGLSSIQKYDMIVNMLPSADLECIQACLDYVAVHVGQERASSLREKLKV
jgi:tetratricopeptide (TPR) repeat protein